MTQAADTARYLVNFSAVYNVTVEVEASDPEEAIKLVRSGDGSIIEETFDRQHPDTEFFVTPKLIDGCSGGIDGN